MVARPGLSFQPQANRTLQSSEREAVTAGLRGLMDRADALGQFEALKKPLPLVNPMGAVPTGGQSVSIGSTLGLTELLDKGLYQPVADYFAQAAEPTTDGLQAVLEGLATASGGLVAVSGVTRTATASKIEYSLTLTASRTNQFALNFGANAIAYGLQTLQEAPLQTSLNLGLTFGVDASKGTTASDAFYVKITNLTASADLHKVAADNFSFDARLGFLRATVDHPTINLDADVHVNFPSPLFLADLQNTPLDDLVTMTTTGNVSAALPLRVTLGNYVVTGAPRIDLNLSNLFGGNNNEPANVSVTPNSDFTANGFIQFANVIAQNVGSLTTQLGDFLDDMRNNEALAQVLPFAVATVGDALNLKQAWTQFIVNRLQNDQGQLQFATVQEFQALFPGLPTGLHYDPVRGELTFDVNFNQALATLSTTLDFNQNLGNLASLSTSSAIDLHANVGGQFTFGFDMQPLGRGFTITDETSLATLNGGKGVQNLAGLPDFVISLSDGRSFQVNIDGKTTVGEILAQLNGLAPSVLEAVIGSDKASLVLRDHSRGAADFTIQDLNTSMAGLPGIGLGIYGKDETPDGYGDREIGGAPLHGDTIVNHFFFDATHAPKLIGTFSLQAADINATARLGAAALQIVHGAGSVNLDALTVSLTDPNNDGRISAQEFLDNINTIATVANPTGSANLTLPVQARLFGVPIGGQPKVNVAWSSAGDANLGFTGLDALQKLQSLSTAKVDDALKALQTQLIVKLGEQSFFKDKLPVLNRSLGELLGLNDKFTTVVAAFESAGEQTLDALEEKLETALETALGRTVTVGIDGPLVDLSLDTSIAAEPALKIQFHWNTTYEGSHTVDLALGGTLGSLVDVRGGAKFDVSANADLDLDLGVKLTTLTPFLYGDSRVAVGASIEGTNLHFSASVGPLGLFIGDSGANNGSVYLDTDGDGPLTDPAKFTLAFGAAADRLLYGGGGADTLWGDQQRGRERQPRR